MRCLFGKNRGRGGGKRLVAGEGQFDLGQHLGRGYHCHPPRAGFPGDWLPGIPDHGVLVDDEIRKALIRSAAPRVGIAVQGDGGNIQSHGHVHGTGVRSHHHPGTGQLQQGVADRSFQGDNRSAAAAADNLFTDGMLPPAGTTDKHGLEIEPLVNGIHDFGISFRRPVFIRLGRSHHEGGHRPGNCPEETVLPGALFLGNPDGPVQGGRGEVQVIEKFEELIEHMGRRSAGDSTVCEQPLPFPGSPEIVAEFSVTAHAERNQACLDADLEHEDQVEALPVELPKKFAQRLQPAGPGKDDETVDVLLMPDQFEGQWLQDPCDMRMRSRRAQTVDKGQRMDYISQGGKTDNQDTFSGYHGFIQLWQAAVARVCRKYPEGRFSSTFIARESAGARAVKIDVSTGELVDKVTILSIKLEKISDPVKIANVRREYELLLPALRECGIEVGSPEFIQLREVNRKLWEIEDRIRIKEAEQCFDREFIELARSVYQINDRRAELKKEISLASNSPLVEEKHYVDYSG